MDGDIVVDQVRFPESQQLVDAGYKPVLRWQRDGLEVSTKTALEAVGAIRRVDVPALKQALAAITVHRDLIVASYADIHVDRGIITAEHLRDGAGIAVSEVIQALDHIIDDEFRSAETRGGS
jgi:hypothetical protein